MKEEMINVNDIAYAVMKDGSVVNNFGDADEKLIGGHIDWAYNPVEI